MNARNRSSLTARQRATSSGEGMLRASVRLRCRGSRTPSVGSALMRRSRTAARNTERTLTKRVLIVPGASAGRSGVLTVIDFTHISTWVVLIARSGIAQNDVDRTASDIATCVLGIHTCREAHDSKNCSRVIDPARPSTHVPDSTLASS